MTRPRAASDAGASQEDVQVPRTTGAPSTPRRLATETTAAFKTTEFWIYILAVGGVLLASYLVDSNWAGVDIFRADKAWLYIVILTIGYLGSRGLAMSGSRDQYDER